jgi:hypothetical protein
MPNEVIEECILYDYPARGTKTPGNLKGKDVKRNMSGKNMRTEEGLHCADWMNKNEQVML